MRVTICSVNRTAGERSWRIADCQGGCFFTSGRSLRRSVMATILGRAVLLPLPGRCFRFDGRTAIFAVLDSATGGPVVEPLRREMVRDGFDFSRS
jgi:hypothetical protein